MGYSRLEIFAAFIPSNVFSTRDKYILEEQLTNDHSWFYLTAKVKVVFAMSFDSTAYPFLKYMSG